MLQPWKQNNETLSQNSKKIVQPMPKKATITGFEVIFYLFFFIFNSAENEIFLLISTKMQTIAGFFFIY